MKNKLIKVCGMRDGKNIRDVEQLGVDIIGLIFYSKSPRYVREMPDYLPRNARRVGIFVNEFQAYIKTMTSRFSLDYIQLHGDESPEYCRMLQAAGLKIIKNIPIATKKDLEKTVAYEGACDYFLFDTKCETRGGSGITFDWNILHDYQGRTPFILSGGIGLNQVNALKTFDHPQLAGYDLNSRFETRPAEKDIEQIKEFIKKLNAI